MAHCAWYVGDAAGMLEKYKEPAMKNQAEYSEYKCPYSHIGKDCGHELHGPEGYAHTYGVWCACGFRGPVFCLEPEDLKLEKLTEANGCHLCEGTGSIPIDNGEEIIRYEDCHCLED